MITKNTCLKIREIVKKQVQLFEEDSSKYEMFIRYPNEKCTSRILSITKSENDTKVASTIFRFEHSLVQYIDHSISAAEKYASGSWAAWRWERNDWSADIIGNYGFVQNGVPCTDEEFEGFLFQIEVQTLYTDLEIEDLVLRPFIEDLIPYGMMISIHKDNLGDYEHLTTAKQLYVPDGGYFYSTEKIDTVLAALNGELS